MNWEIVGALGELLGGITVVLSVLYLAYQVRESRLHAIAAGQRDALTTAHLYIHIATTPGATSDWRQGLNQYEDLDPDVQARFNHLLQPHINHVEAVFRMHQNGLVDKESYERWMAGIVGILKTKGGQAWWTRMSPLFGPEYVAELNCMCASTNPVYPPLTDFWHFYNEESLAKEVL